MIISTEESSKNECMIEFINKSIIIDNIEREQMLETYQITDAVSGSKNSYLAEQFFIYLK